MRRRSRVLLALVILLAAGALAAWRMLYIPPLWYRPPDPHDERVAILADRAEYRLVEETQRVREPEEMWTLRIQEDQINAWLSARLPQWIAHEADVEWPANVGTPQVNLEEDGVSLAVPIASAGAGGNDGENGAGGGGGGGAAGRTLVLRLRPAIEGGGLRLEIDRLQLGMIPLPGEPLAKLAEKLEEYAPGLIDDPQVQQVIDVLAGRARVDPVLELSDGRRVRLRAVRLHKGAIDLTAQTLAE